MHRKFCRIVLILTMGVILDPYGKAFAQDFIPTRKVNKLDNFIKKMYLVANDVFTSDDYTEAFGSLPTKGVYIKTAADNNSEVKKHTENTEVDADDADEAVIDEDPPKEFEAPKGFTMGGPVLPPVAEADLGIDVDVDVDVSNEGGVGGLIAKRNVKKKESAGGGVSPLYWEQVRAEYKKKREEQKRLAKEKEGIEMDSTGVSLEENENEIVGESKLNLILKRRPEDDYRTERLPSAISKKQYTRDNQHLPQVVYENEYKTILFNSILAQDIDVMRAMIERMGTTEIRDGEGNTPLLYAVMADKDISAKVLVGMGAGIDVINYDGVGPLYVAMKEGKKSMTNLLLTRGGNAKILTKNGKTLLMLSAEDDNMKMAKTLLQKGLGVNDAMDDGNTALHFAAKHDSHYVAKLLIAKGAELDKRNFEGYTPLMIASAYGAENIVDILINSEADITITDALGQDAYKFATMNKHHTIVAMLVSAMAKLNDAPRKKVFYSPIDRSLAKIPNPMKRPLAPPVPKFTDAEKEQMSKPKAIPVPKFGK